MVGKGYVQNFIKLNALSRGLLQDVALLKHNITSQVTVDLQPVGYLSCAARLVSFLVVIMAWIASYWPLFDTESLT